MSSTSSTPTSQDNAATLTISPDPGFTLTFSGMVVTEELGRPFEAQLDVSSATRKGGLTSMLGCSVTVAIQLPGRPASATSTASSRAPSTAAWRPAPTTTGWSCGRGSGCCRRPATAGSSRTRRCGRSSPRCSATAGFTDFSDKRQSQSGDITLDYCVQFEETATSISSRG